MAINTFPAVASPVKSIQRGSAGGAGSVTITAVDISKSMVNIQGSASSGTVSASFNMSMNAGNTTAFGEVAFNNNNFGDQRIKWPGSTAGWGNSAPQNNDSPQRNPTNTNSWSVPVAVNSGNASVGAGSTNLVAAQVTGFLANSTTLTVSGACRYEVVEYN